MDQAKDTLLLQPRCIVVIPTYNERENIANLIGEISSLESPLDILVVDDSSPDGTGELVTELMAEYPNLSLLSRETKNGLGPAYVAGFRHVLARGYQYIIQMDADFSHQPRYLRPLLEACRKGNALTIGSRYVSGGSVQNWPLIRQIVSWGGSLYACKLLNVPINDLTAGFKCWRAEALSSVLEKEVQSNGYNFQIEMTFRAIQQGYSVHELPITFIERERGKSKMSLGIVVEAAVVVIKLMLDQQRTSRKLKHSLIK